MVRIKSPVLKHPDTYYYNIARKNIRKYRKYKGLTQQALADMTELSMHFIAEIEQIKRQKAFSIATLGRIADALEVDISLFFDENTIKEVD